MAFSEGELNRELAGEMPAYVINLRAIDGTNAALATAGLDNWLVEQRQSGQWETGGGKYLIVDGCLVVFHYSVDHSNEAVHVAAEMGLQNAIGECGGAFSYFSMDNVVRSRKIKTGRFSMTLGRDQGVSERNQAENLQRYLEQLKLLDISLAQF